jgi:polyphenol oxidase
MTMVPRMGEEFRWREHELGPLLECVPLAHIAAHCFTGRVASLGPSRQIDEHWWTRLAQYVGNGTHDVVQLKQVHGSMVYVASDGHSASSDARPEADAVVSNRPHQVLTVQAADCVPVLLADPRTGAVAAVHSGWRGVAAKVSSATVRALEGELGVRAGDLVAAVGPSIGRCCYEVGEELLTRFTEAGIEESKIRRWFSREDGRWRLDLWNAVRDQLEASGVQSENIHVAGLCTASNLAWFPSYRAEGPGTGRLVAAISSRGL